ncbi:zinc-dependent alcohol dehydrogenase family protein [uncultured Jatrophihabitans sp.]|uniref:zinc-dependent alcohol dehydrogenase family protein n=1 Tax=uncultured Jatrophihabitans sp. TaxID=1610747 RepID=UPI0035CA0CAB
MKAAVVKSVGEVGIETVDDPTPGDGEVVVEVAACGLCGTDLHILQGEFAPTLPIIPGHEFAGTVVAVGRNALDVQEGDRVAVDPSLYCQECHYCRLGRNNLCLRWGAIGVTVPGGAAEYVAVPAANCVRLPDHVATADATLVEPLSCAVRGYDVLSSQLGAHVLIYGAGTMGLMMLRLAQRVGAVSIDVVDLNADRLEIARGFGVTHAETTAEGLEPKFGWNLVIDATGNAAAIQDGLGRVAPGGTFLQFGVADYAARATIDPYRIYNKEITITGSMAVLHSYERAADLFATGVIDPELFITDRVPLDRYADAIAAFKSGAGLKTQVVPQGA